MNRAQPALIDLRTHTDPYGALCFVEGEADIPFAIARTYFMHSVPDGAKRGFHAHRKLEQVLIAAQGAVTVDLETPDGTFSFTLTGPDIGLYIPPFSWRELRDFAPHTVCVVLASQRYDVADYIRDYDVFRDAIRAVHANPVS